nr:hypothetical protein [Prevotella sp.]
MGKVHSLSSISRIDHFPDVRKMVINRMAGITAGFFSLFYNF